MPVWLQVIWALVAPVMVSVAGWVTVQVWNMRIRMAELEAEIRAIKPRCQVHEGELAGVGRGLARIDRNLVRISQKLGVDGIENPPS